MQTAKVANRSHEYKDAVREYGDGKIHFDEFARRTRPRWEFWAKRFERQWKLPTWLGREDLEQELLFAAWKTIPGFDPSRGTNIDSYVQFGAVKSVSKKVHKARGVEQHRRTGPPRFELPEACLSKPGAEDDDMFSIDTMACVEPTQEAGVERSEKYAVLRGLCEWRHELIVMLALLDAGGDPGGAALLIAGDTDAMMSIGYAHGDVQGAETLVNQVVKKFTEEYGCSEEMEEDNG